jgi:hypothetical protein
MLLFVSPCLWFRRSDFTRRNHSIEKVKISGKTLLENHPIKRRQVPDFLLKFNRIMKLCHNDEGMMSICLVSGGKLCKFLTRWGDLAQILAFQSQQSSPIWNDLSLPATKLTVSWNIWKFLTAKTTTWTVTISWNKLSPMIFCETAQFSRFRRSQLNQNVCNILSHPSKWIQAIAVKIPINFLSKLSPNMSHHFPQNHLSQRLQAIFNGLSKLFSVIPMSAEEGQSPHRTRRHLHLPKSSCPPWDSVLRGKARCDRIPPALS